MLSGGFGHNAGPDYRRDANKNVPFSGGRTTKVCGRINLWVSPADLTEMFELFREPEWSSRYNIGPMQQVLAVRIKPDGVRLAESLQWGLVPRWAKEPSVGSHMFNARSDTVTIKPAFRELIHRQRCLIPANGFYEWQQINSKLKQPWHIFRADGQPLVLAGLWEHWQSPDGDILESCTMITTDANERMAEIHTRMPVILAKENWNLWLEHHEIAPAVLAELLRPSPSDWIEMTPVSSLVNSVRNDSPECIEPVKRVRTLF